MKYVLIVNKPYEQDDWLDFDSLGDAILYIRKRGLYLDDCTVYPSSCEVNLYDVMDPKTERLGGKAYLADKES